MADQPLLTVEQLAAKLALSRSYCYRLVAERRIPFVKIHGSVRFDEAEIDAWLAAMKTKAVR